MTVLKRISRHYNPLGVEHGGKIYELDKIKVYNSEGVIVEGGSWFGGNNNIIDQLEINGDTKKVNINNLNFNNNYNLIVKEEQPRYKNSVVYTLYINADNIKLYSEGIEDNSLYIEVNYYSRLYKEISFRKILLFKDQYQYSQKYKEIEKRFSHLYSNHAENAMELNEIINELKELKENEAKIEEAQKMLTKQTYERMIKEAGARELDILENCRAWKLVETQGDRLVIEIYNNSYNKGYNCSGEYDLISGKWVG